MPTKKVTKVKRAKAGKGKKDGKQESKADRESDIEKARANAVLWELRFKDREQALKETSEAAFKLGRTNEYLTNQLYRAEQDAVDTAGHWERKRVVYEKEINTLQERLRSQEAHAREEQNKLVEEYTLRINEMQELFRKKSSDFNMIQDGMREIKKFQTRKAQMEQELSDIRESMELAEKEHRENLNEMENKFFKEKVRLEKEAEQKIVQVVEMARKEAIEQLDDASRSVFKENVRLNEALKYHVKEAEDLHKLTKSLEKVNASLALDKKEFEMKAKENAAQMKAPKEELSKLKAKVASLEQSLEIKAGEQEREREGQRKGLVSIMANDVKLQKQRRERERELREAKGQLSNMVSQRRELEEFFHGALAEVRQEIMANRKKYIKDAQQDYRWRMREATAGGLKFPPIRTFHKSPHSTNSVYSDVEAAARWTHPPGSKVEMSDLTWEQKEQVLGLLFAKMNVQRERKASQHLALSASCEKSLVDRDAAE
ncbi:basal body-orientation factor 1 [Pagrus major]|uniref:basal body-orientation factor 1 n=1 Tax=Pagrus major TaxID=143350 RepID=UPI003CC83ABB